MARIIPCRTPEEPWPLSPRESSSPALRARSLRARLDQPVVPPLAYALFAHCFTCSRDTPASAYVAAALSERGIAVLHFDFTGLGGSERDFANKYPVHRTLHSEVSIPTRLAA